MVAATGGQGKYAAPLMTTPPLPMRNDPLAALPRLDRHKPKFGPVAKSKASRWRAYVLILVHVLIGLHVLHWSMTGRTVTPVEPSEAMQTFELGTINAGFLLFLALIASTLVFGRWFCGWACHVVALQDLSAWLLGRIGLKPRPIRSRVLLFAPFVVAGHMFLWPHVKHWLDPVTKPMPKFDDWEWHLTTDAFWATFPGWIMSSLSVLVVGFLIVWWMGAKGFCNFGCPYGAFFAVADRFSPGKIKVTDACDACGHCTQVCSSNVRVHEEVAIHKMVVDPACMKCMDCVSVCPKDALYFGAALPKPFAVSQQRKNARADFTWGEDLAIGAIALLATEWGFRRAGFGEQIPFLLSVGLGAITATAALLGWRLLRRRDVLFQHASLKQAGSLLPRGRLVALAVFGWLLFALHTGVVNQMAQAALDESAVVLGEQRRTRAVKPADLQAASEALARVDRFALWTPPAVLALHGLLLREVGQDALAVQQFERMVERRGFDPAKHNLAPADNALALYYAVSGQNDRAALLAEFVLEANPGDATSREILRRLGREPQAK